MFIFCISTPFTWMTYFEVQIDKVCTPANEFLQQVTLFRLYYEAQIPSILELLDASACVTSSRTELQNKARWQHSKYIARQSTRQQSTQKGEE